MRLPVALVVVALLFVGWCIAFASITPYRTPGFLRYQRAEDGSPVRTIDVGAPDELQHVNYIRHILDGKGFPVLRLNDPELGANYQSHQPPLYYVLSAGWAKALGLDLTQQSAKIPMRILNTFIGLFTLAGVFLGMRWAYGRDDIAAAATVIAGLLPMMIALHGAVSNDPLLFALSSWVVAMCILGVQKGWTTKVAVVTGLLAGLALLTKTNAVALLPVIALALFMGRRSSPKVSVKVVLLAIALPFLLAAPWWIRNQQLYGDPLGLQLFTAAFQGSPQASVFIQGLGAKAYWVDMVAWWTGRSFVGVFGYMDIFLFETMGSDKAAALYRFLLAVFGIMGLGALTGLLSTQDQAKKEGVATPNAFAVLGGAFVVIVTILFLRFNAQYFQGQARYLFPAILPIAGFLAVGACTIGRRKPAIVWIVLLVFLTVLDVLSYQTIRAGFPLRLGLG